MNYILFILVLLIKQNDATDDSQNRRNGDDSFNINIGAGYAVGLDGSPNNNPPNGTSNITFSKSYRSNPLRSETLPNANSIRSPRILTNFTPQISNQILEKPKAHVEQQNHASNYHYKEQYTAAPSNIHSFNAPSFETSAEEHFDHPNLVDFQNILKEIETKKPYSKILQVIKVPAIYEIHLQSEHDNKSQTKVNINPTGDFFWKNYYENKPNITTKYSDDYSKWLTDSHSQREEQFTKDGEKYYDFSDTPVVTYETYQESQSPDDKIKAEDILEPIISHHYSNTKAFPESFDSKKEVKINYSSEPFDKPLWVNKDNYYKRKPVYPVNSFKRHAGYSAYPSRGLNPTIKPLQNEVFNSYGVNIKNTSPFKHNQALTENDKPQALHEVPPPFLGKYPQSKPFEFQKASHTNTYSKVVPTPTTLHPHGFVKFSKQLPATTKPNNYKATNGLSDSKFSQLVGKREKVLEPQAVPSSKQFASYINGNQNLIYGKKNEHVLTPYQINIPVTPGTTMVTVTQRPDNIAKSSVQRFQYSSKIKGNVQTEKPFLENTYKFQAADTQIPNRSGQSLHSFTTAKSDFKGFSPSQEILGSVPSDYYKETVPQISINSANQNFQHSEDKNAKNNSEKSEILDSAHSKYYQQVVVLPYQTQKSITSENIISTTPVSTLKSSENPQNAVEIPITHQSESLVKGGTNVASSGVPTFPAKQDSRRRSFFNDFNWDNSFTKNSFINSNHNFKGLELSKPFHGKNNASRLDYIIYITRKSTH